jgi:hypothetical protein
LAERGDARSSGDPSFPTRNQELAAGSSRYQRSAYKLVGSLLTTLRRVAARLRRRFASGLRMGGTTMLESDPAAQLYARKVGETQRELQIRERERARLVGVVDHGFIDLEIAEAGGDEAEVARRARRIEATAAAQRDELFRISVEILKLQDRLLYYRQLEALYADGTFPPH